MPNKLNTMDEKKFLPDLFDQQLFDVLHPTRFKQNFGALHSFKSYIKEYCKPHNRKYVQPTLAYVLKEYEECEGYEQCFILKEILDKMETDRTKKIKNL